MYKIFADDTLIYDSTLEDYKIGKGQVTLETNKSGSFVFSLYPDHFYYDRFVKMRTVITVYKSERIVFRGRVLSDVTDHWNNKVLTCEGELGFLQDSIVRPFTFSGSPAALFAQLVNGHNAQVDEFKRFKVGTVTVVDGNDYIARENEGYESTLSNLTSRLLEDATGGHLFITHDDGDPIPTLHYLADFTNVATQTVEFGANLKDYTKTTNAEEIATAIIPIGATVSREVVTGYDEEGEPITEDVEEIITIEKVNGGKDYVYSAEGVALYGWIFKQVDWEDVTEPANLLTKAQAYVDNAAKQNITLELNAIDLHLLDRSIESIHLCDYVRVISAPHGFDSTLLCNKQTLDLLKPENDTLVLGYTYYTFTESSTKTAVGAVSAVKKTVASVSGQVVKVGAETAQNAENLAALTNRVTQLEEAGGTAFTTDETLSMTDGVLSVNRAYDVEADNTLPVTSAAVYVEVGNIDALLKTI